MYNLFLCFLPMRTKEFYLTVNIADVALAVLNLCGYYSFQIHGNNIVNLIPILNIALIVTAIVCLVIFMMHGRFTTVWHRIYVIVRIFLSIFLMIVYTSFLIGILTRKHMDVNELILACAYWTLGLISASWSYYLMKIIL